MDSGLVIMGLLLVVVLVPSVLLLRWRDRRIQQRREAEAFAEQQAMQARAIAEEQARQLALRQRFDYLSQRFGPDIAQRIMHGKLWVGSTADMVREILGAPMDIDEKFLKTKTKHTWKYNPSGANRDQLRVALENGIVVGWC
ncbi:hypothetical protein WMF38_19460 [Sorangium sp. So ce118]